MNLGFSTAQPDPLLAVLGLLVGLAVGLTGVGGGSLLTPLLVLVAGVRPVYAVGTDLAFAAITKAVGAWQHRRSGTVDLTLTWQLSLGSIPGALLGSAFVTQLASFDSGLADAVLSRLLGITLVAAATATLLRATGRGARLGGPSRPGPRSAAALGFGIGLLVGLTSIGAGSLLMAAFALLYAIPPLRAVGTDVVHGAILAAVAAVAHGLGGQIEPQILVPLLIGSVPGVVLGSRLCARLPAMPVRLGIAALLIVAGLRLL